MSRELLERAFESMKNRTLLTENERNLEKEVSYYLLSKQDEKAIAYWDTQEGKLIPAVPLSSERTCFEVPLVPLYLHPAPEATQDKEPIGYVITIDPSKSYRQDSWVPWKEVEGMNGGKIRDDIPDGSFVYLHPAPHPHPFIRLTEEDIKNCWGEPDRLNTQALINFARAIEDALEEKNNAF